MCQDEVVVEATDHLKEPSMVEISTVGVDLAKHVFQVHGVDASGQVLLRRQLRRSEVLKFFGGLERCVVGMEACGSAHYWARELGKLGHEVRLLPPARVKAYVKQGKKNDAADAAAICEAATRPHMQFVSVKTAEQQGVIMLHRTRDILVRQRTMLINALRGHLAEFGIVAGQGKGNFTKLRATLAGAASDALPEPALVALQLMAGQIDDANEKIEILEKQIVVRHRSQEVSLRLASIPGIGPIIASAIAAAVPDASVFTSGRQFAAWLGLVPRQNSTGGKERLGGITKTGDRYLRRLLVIGATGLIRYKRKNIPGGVAWVNKLLARKPVRLVSVALANKMARIVWAVLCRGEVYRDVGAASAA
jgi:transposase